jgi:hypothetical protein
MGRQRDAKSGKSGKKDFASQIPEKESKKDQRLKKKEYKKLRDRQKDYNTGEERSFCALLVTLNLRIKYMDGDGNCMVAQRSFNRNATAALIF